MQFNCQNNHPYKNLIEYINEIEAANLIKDYLQLIKSIDFGHTDSVTIDTITLKYTTIDNLVDNGLTKREILYLHIDRYLNSIHTLLLTNETNSSEIYIRLGEFREIITYHFSQLDEDSIKSFVNMFIDCTSNNIDEQKELLIMENLLSNSYQEGHYKYIKDMCSVIVDNINDKDQLTKSDKINNKDNNTNRYSIKSLIIPRIAPMTNVNGMKIGKNKEGNPRTSYLNSIKYAKFLQNQLDTNLQHHIKRLSKNQKINKNKVYSAYGVTPNLHESTNKSSEHVRSYDEELKSIESNLKINQLIMLSFLMFIREYDEVVGNGILSKGQTKAHNNYARHLHQVITKPFSNVQVPKQFLKLLNTAIHEYAENTRLSNDKNDTKDEKLVDLIKAYLSFRFSLPTLVDYNNLIFLTDNIKDNLYELVVYGSDYNALLNIRPLIEDIQTAYNCWIENVKENDLDYTEESNLRYSSLLFSKDSISTLEDQIIEDSFIKSRFQYLVKIE